MATPLHKNPCPGGHEIYNFGLDPSSVIITIHFSALCLGVEKNIFKKYINFNFLSQNYLALGCRVTKFTISCLLTLEMLHSKFGKDWPSRS